MRKRKVNEVFEIDFQIIPNSNLGNLYIGEISKHVPYVIQRFFFITDVPNRSVVRGNHAHYETKQVLVNVSGSCIVGLFDGKEEKEITLNDPGKGLFVGPMIWHTMHSFSSDSILLVLASTLYQESDYIRNLEDFIKLVK